MSDQQPDTAAAAAPLRVATYDYTQHGPDSPTADRRQTVLADYIAARPSWHLAATYRDHAHPGRTRPGLCAVLADAQAGRFDILLVASIDRLGRRLGDLAAVVEQLTRAGVHVVAADSAFDTSTNVGRVMATMLAVFGEYDRHMTEEREDRQRGGDAIVWRLPLADADLVHNALRGAVRRWEETAAEATAGAHRPPQPQPAHAAGATINVEPTPADTPASPPSPPTRPPSTSGWPTPWHPSSTLPSGTRRPNRRRGPTRWWGSGSTTGRYPSA